MYPHRSAGHRERLVQGSEARNCWEGLRREDGLRAPDLVGSIPANQRRGMSPGALLPVARRAARLRPPGVVTLADEEAEQPMRFPEEEKRSERRRRRLFRRRGTRDICSTAWRLADEKLRRCYGRARRKKSKSDGTIADWFEKKKKVRRWRPHMREGRPFLPTQKKKPCRMSRMCPTKRARSGRVVGSS